jgi:hypothetical protein
MLWNERHPCQAHAMNVNTNQQMRSTRHRIGLQTPSCNIKRSLNYKKYASDKKSFTRNLQAAWTTAAP